MHVHHNNNGSYGYYDYYCYYCLTTVSSFHELHYCCTHHCAYYHCCHYCMTSLHSSSHYVFCLGMHTVGKTVDWLLRAVHTSPLTSTTLMVILLRAQQAGIRSGTTAVLRTHSFIVASAENASLLQELSCCLHMMVICHSSCSG